MKQRTALLLLIAFFLLTLSLRLFFAFQVQGFTGDVSYYSIRQAEVILETGTPAFDDHLSFGGRTNLFTPLFYYLLAGVGLFVPLELAGKILPNLFASLAVFPIFFISRELTKNPKISLFATFISTFVPIYFAETVNTISPYSLVIPLMLCLLYLFIMINRGIKYQIFFLICLLAALFTHPSASLFILGLAIFIVLMKIEKMKVAAAEIELTLFSIMFTLWFYFLIFKDAFLLYGAKIIRSNIPASILERYFSDITIVAMVQLIGVIPFFYGLYILYKYTFKQKNRNIFLILGFLLGISLLLWLKVIPFRQGLMFLGIFLILLISAYLKLFFEYLRKTRFSRFENVFIFSLITAFITTSFIPTIIFSNQAIEDAYSQPEIESFTWMSHALPDNAVVLASPNEGHLITALAKRKNVIDSQFLLIDDIDKIFSDVESIYQTKYQTQAVDLLSEYDVTYIYLSPRVMAYYGVSGLSYVDENLCFEEIYDMDGIKIYSSRCHLGGDS